MLLDLLLEGDFRIELIIGSIFASLLVVFITLPIHEWAHAFVANKLGDPTAKYMGRLTLNPLKHIDPIGATMIVFIGFGWAKPVPVEMHRFQNPKRDMAITALAGPASNLILATISLFFFNLLNSFNLISSNVIVQYLYAICYYMFFMLAQINISLAIFNLIPIPPLDGSRILNAFLPDRIYYRLMQFERYFFIIIFLIVRTFSSFLSGLVDGVFMLLFTLTNLPFSF